MTTPPADAPEWLGFDNRECGEHRPLIERAWCSQCREYCYQQSPCKGCELPLLRALIAESVVALERVGCQFWACKGPTHEPVDMETCFVDELIPRLRAALGR